jgi:hypothetical protein
VLGGAKLFRSGPEWPPSSLVHSGRPQIETSDRKMSFQRKLRISTRSVVSSPRAKAACLPSREKAKSQINPALKLVRARGGPPASGCAQRFDVVVVRYDDDLVVGF